MSYLRSDIKTEVRDLFYETVADLIADTQLNRLIKQEIRSLPRKGIYLEEIWSTSTVIGQQSYTLPTGAYKIEKLEMNYGTTSNPDWQEFKGWDIYSNALYFPYIPDSVEPIRAHLRKAFSDLTDDVTNSDIPDEKMEVVIQGVLVRAYRMILGYLKNAKNWDAVAKPNGISLNQILAVYREEKDEYQRMVQKYKTIPLPREINLVG